MGSYISKMIRPLYHIETVCTIYNNRLIFCWRTKVHFSFYDQCGRFNRFLMCGKDYYFPGHCLAYISHAIMPIFDFNRETCTNKW